VHATLAIPAAQDATEDYPLAMDDLELGDFLADAMHGVAPSMEATAHGVAPAPMDELAACDALHILGDLPHPHMNLPPP